VVDRLKAEYEGIVEFRIINVDTDPEGQALMAKYGAQFVPTFVFLRSDGSVSEMIVGAQSESVLGAALNALQ
jgi:thioredoxin-like negative regulator of GroEL